MSSNVHIVDMIFSVDLCVFNSCGVVEFPLWIGLVLPLGIVFIIHCISNILIVGKILTMSNMNVVVNHSRNSNDSQQLLFNDSKKQNFTIVMLNILFFAIYAGLICGLLSVHRGLIKYSQSFQVLYAILTITQGSLLFSYMLCSTDLKTSMCCRSSRNRTVIEHNICSTPTTDTSTAIEHNIPTTETTSASLIVEESRKCKKSKNKVIPTETNPAYETVIFIRKKEQVEMTENPLYSVVSKTKRAHNVY